MNKIQITNKQKSMWWLILIGIMIFTVVLMGTTLNPIYEKTTHPKKKKILEHICIGLTILDCLIFAIFAFYFIGWLWYFCGGFLVIDCSDGFWEYVFNGLISLIPLFGILGLIMILFGWDPDKK